LLKGMPPPAYHPRIHAYHPHCPCMVLSPIVYSRGLGFTPVVFFCDPMLDLSCIIFLSRFYDTFNPPPFSFDTSPQAPPLLLVHYHPPSFASPASPASPAYPSHFRMSNLARNLITHLSYDMIIPLFFVCF
jgi:hypothetical protein